jgi:hypothetical protein
MKSMKFEVDSSIEKIKDLVGINYDGESGDVMWELLHLRMN